MTDTTSNNQTDRRPSGMRTFIAIFLAMHIPLFVYPVVRISHWLQLESWMMWLILVPIVSSQVISRWLLRDPKARAIRFLRQVADFILGVSPIVVLTLLLFEVLVLLGVVAAYQAAVAVLVIAGAISTAGLLIALKPFVRTIRFESEQLAEPLRFVQISDVHIGSRSQSFLEKIVSQIEQLEPEFLCITGDFIDATGVTVAELASLKRLKCPIYFSIGNHERYEDLEDILERLASLDVQILRTDALHHRADVQVIGIDDRDDAHQVAKEISKVTVDQNAFGVLMYHRPRGIEAADEAGVDLMLSGHTHNGQIFPFNLVVRRVFDKVAGMYQHGTARLYVSQGTGTWGPVMRVGTRAEITLFELEPGK